MVNSRAEIFTLNPSWRRVAEVTGPMEAVSIPAVDRFAPNNAAKFLAVDELAALFVVTVILWSGSKLLWTSAQELMDAQADEPFVSQIRKAAIA